MYVWYKFQQMCKVAVSSQTQQEFNPLHFIWTYTIRCCRTFQLSLSPFASSHLSTLNHQLSLILMIASINLLPTSKYSWRELTTRPVETTAITYIRRSFGIQVRSNVSWSVLNIPPQMPVLLTWIPQTETRYVAGGSRPIYGVRWLHALIRENVQLHMVYVKDILGCGWHCIAPRYQKGMMVNPGPIKETATGHRQLKITIKALLFISVREQCELAWR